MQLRLDIVDLLQLQEIWSRRPVVTAFTRLEGRPAAMPCSEDFNVDGLLPRLARLRLSPLWRVKHLNNDPARVPLHDFSDAYLHELYPEGVSGAVIRQMLFVSAYNRFVMAHFRGEIERVCAIFRALVVVRQIDADDCLDSDIMPRKGSSEWIPADITDEIRSLDVRYNPAEPGLPAAYVVSDSFWSLLIKAEKDEFIQAARNSCGSSEEANCMETLMAMAQVAYAWNRSPSVVGLCYQVE